MTALAQILSQARRHPERVACRCGDMSMTYGELRREALWLAAVFTGLLPPGRPLAVYGHKQPRMAAVFLACGLSGRPYVPIDTALPAGRIQDVLSQLDDPPLLAVSPLSFAYDHTLPDPLPAAELTGAPLRLPRPEDVCYIIFTSGSTGLPKGVPVTHANLRNFVRFLHHVTLPLDGPVLNTAAFSFDLSVADLYLGLTTGRTLVMLEQPSRQSFPGLFAALAEANPATAVLTPSFATYLLTDRQFASPLLPRLSELFFCGEPLPSAIASRLFERFPGLRILNAYGPTECTCAVTAALITPDMSDPLPVSQPGMPAASAVIVCDRQGNELPEDESGEILITGDSVAPGYLHGLAGGFTVREGRRAYRTGDLGYMRAGALYCAGRLDDQLKLSGYRIEPGDIEAQLLQLDTVVAAAVLPRFDDAGGAAQLVAFVCLQPGMQQTSAVLRSALSERLPAYMLPRIRILPALPMNENGKCDKAALKKTDIMKLSVPKLLAEVCGSDSPIEEPAIDLVESGLLDSLALVQLLERLEYTFNVTIYPTEVNPAVWRSVAAITELVEQAMEHDQ